MATLTAHTPFAAYAPVFDASSFAFVYGTVETFSPTRIRTVDGARSQEYLGTGFTRDAQGNLVAGVLEQTRCWVDGRLQYQIEGLNLPAPAVAALDPATNRDGGLVYLLFQGDDRFVGSPGNDLFEGWFGRNAIDGGAGVDTAAYMLGRDDYTVARQGAEIVVTKRIGPGQIDTLSRVERLQFLDRGLAFDLGPGEAAANTALVIGAAFGAAAVAVHPDWVSTGLERFDGGQTMRQVCDWVAGQVMRSSNAAFVDTVFRNVVGRLPTPHEHDQYVALLQGEGGSMSQGELLEFAAESAVNEVTVDLVGLQSVGLEFW